MSKHYLLSSLSLSSFIHPTLMTYHKSKCAITNLWILFPLRDFPRCLKMNLVQVFGDQGSSNVWRTIERGTLARGTVIFWRTRKVWTDTILNYWFIKFVWFFDILRRAKKRISITQIKKYAHSLRLRPRNGHDKRCISRTLLIELNCHFNLALQLVSKYGGEANHNICNNVKDDSNKR